MTKLTDLEVCKRIAEIEGYKLNEFCEKTGFTSCSFIDKSKLQMSHISFNPLTDKALCWDLMIKHGIDLSENDDFYYASYSLWLFPEEENNKCNQVYNQCPHRAVCLAIIEMHNDN